MKVKVNKEKAINEKEKDLKGRDKEAWESLVVAVYNGTVYEP